MYQITITIEGKTETFWLNVLPDMNRIKTAILQETLRELANRGAYCPGCRCRKCLGSREITEEIDIDWEIEKDLI